MPPRRSAPIVLEAGRIDTEYFRDLWRFRELFMVLAWRDLSVRYKQTAIGVAWAVLRPALSAAIFTLVFGRLARMPSDGAPYPALVLAGMLPWQLFSSGMSESANSLVINASLITKVYFPRLIIPASAMVTSLVDFAISATILGVVMLVYGVVPTWRLLLLPGFLALALLCAAGVGVWISALNVKYRDFAFAVPFIAQLGLYVSPVGFSSSVVPERLRALYSLNPIVGVIDGFRWCLLGGATPLDPLRLGLSIGVALVLAGTGLWHFRRTERAFADVI